MAQKTCGHCGSKGAEGEVIRAEFICAECINEAMVAKYGHPNEVR